MTLRAKLVFYVAILHIVFAGLAVVSLRDSPWSLLSLELAFLLSLGLGIRWVYQLFVPLNLVRTGAELIDESDFTSKFVEVGQPEMDQLVRVYNRMIDQLREERLRLQEQHYFLHRVLEASPSGVITFDLDGRVDRANPSASRLLGVDAAGLAGMRLADVPGDCGRAIDTLALGASCVIALGAGRRVKVTKAHFMDRGFARAFVMIDELTEELRLSERSAYEKVIRLLSHEVNNSVAAIRSLLESATAYASQIETDDRPDFETALTVSAERAQHLAAFMSRFADVVRLPDPVRRPVDLMDLLRHVERLLHVDCEQRLITWQWDVQQEPASIDMDADQIEQVLVNVAKNAMEAIGEHGCITVRLGADGPHPWLALQDTGPGVSAQGRERLFTPFYSSKPGGQGIGLTLSADILSRHGFRFDLDSPPGGPTTFTIWFSTLRQNP